MPGAFSWLVKAVAAPTPSTPAELAPKQAIKPGSAGGGVAAADDRALPTMLHDGVIDEESEKHGFRCVGVRTKGIMQVVLMPTST
jgi:hypothetical protein